MASFVGGRSRSLDVLKKSWLWPAIQFSMYNRQCFSLKWKSLFIFVENYLRNDSNLSIILWGLNFEYLYLVLDFINIYIPLCNIANGEPLLLQVEKVPQNQGKMIIFTESIKLLFAKSRSEQINHALAMTTVSSSYNSSRSS